LRSSLIDIFTGILPAAGSSISNILAYDQAEKSSKTPELFGTGCEDGIVEPKSANNATAGGSLITMMALGIPGDIVTAVMFGAVSIHDVVPSPSFIGDQPLLAYGIFIAFFVAHFMMLGLQSVTLKLFVLVTKVRMYVLASIILSYCAIVVFAIHNVQFDAKTQIELATKLGRINIQPYYVYNCDMVISNEHFRISIPEMQHLEREVRGSTDGFNTPLFIVDTPGGGGKRDVHSYENRNEEYGMTSCRSPSVNPNRMYYYFDPLRSLAPEVQAEWQAPGGRVSIFQRFGLDGKLPTLKSRAGL
jgi:hypothetical protein